MLWWRTLLRAVALLNLALWALAAAAVVRHAPASPGAACFAQLVLSGAYVAGCAFRSLLPVFDGPRLVLIDSPLSNVLIGRSVATIAELCFAAQWALMLSRIGLLTHSPFAHALSLTLLPLIVIAEVCSWHAVLTTAQRGHVFENSIWGLAAAVLIAGLLAIGPARLASLYPPMLAWCLGGAVYVIYIFVFDVPMYQARWRADQAAGRRYLSIAAGLSDVRRRWVVSQRLEDWKNEIPWMSLYFTLGVWSSISLIYAALALGC